MVAGSTGLPGGRGPRHGPDAGVDQADWYEQRQQRQDKTDGWIVSTVGDHVFGHFDVTGVSAVANQLSFYYVPERVRNSLIVEARIVVAASIIAATFRTALFVLVKEPKLRLMKIPATEVSFDCSSVGLKQKTLQTPVQLLVEQHLFIARWASSASIVVEGFQSGASPNPRVLRQLTTPNIAPPFSAEYQLSFLTKATGTADTPMIAYLSNEATQVF